MLCFLSCCNTDRDHDRYSDRVLFSRTYFLKKVLSKIHLCQSCSVPLESDALRGTEPDGSPSAEYCSSCYAGGKFLQPEIGLEEMKENVRNRIEGMNLPLVLREDLINLSLMLLPGLKRWSDHHSVT